MTNNEKIKAEIERLKEIGCPLQKGSDYQHGYDEFYTQIKKFINTLAAEYQSEEFKEEFDNFLVHGNIRNPNFEGPFGYDDIRKTAMHFANWKKEQIINKASKWLAGNIIHYIWSSKREIGISDDFFIDFEKAMEE